VLQSDLFQCQVAPDGLQALDRLIASAIRDDAPAVTNEGGMIKTGFDPQLDELIQISRDAKGYLAQLEVKEKSASGINSLKVRYNKVFGYYIEVPKTHTERVPAHYVRKQTLVNAERYITDELKQFETKVFTAEEKRAALELAVFNSIQEQVKDKSTDLAAMAGFLAGLDCLTALAELADICDYCRPSINTEGIIRLVDGRHPVVEKMISGERFVPNTIALDNREQQVLIITGPNMAGKSTVLRQVALSVIMAQLGSFVPAAEADIGVVDRIFTRVGALDNLSAGQSTFMVEMEETANILNNATAQSLVIMDEIGRGTSTYDGLSIAWAVAEYLQNLNQVGVKTLFATHYHELTVLADTKSRVKNFNIAVKEWNDQIVFLRKLIPGGTNRSYGIQVAQLAGLPEEVIAASKTILERIESKVPGADQMSVGPVPGRGERPPPVQLDLFGPAESKILEQLRSIDINQTTPMAALQLLQDLHTTLKKRGH
jgi:DNA mismatch repair protein MutS